MIIFFVQMITDLIYDQYESFNRPIVIMKAVSLIWVQIDHHNPFLHERSPLEILEPEKYIAIADPERDIYLGGRLKSMRWHEIWSLVQLNHKTMQTFLSGSNLLPCIQELGAWVRTGNWPFGRVFV